MKKASLIGFEVGQPTIWLQGVLHETPAGLVLKLEVLPKIRTGL